jgi:beta-lactamase regulating signal transducer with metallopeptidase domain
LAWLAESRWLGLLAGTLIKTTAALVPAVLIAAILRRRSAALRHFILSVFLIGLLLIPILPSIDKGWKTPLLPSWATLGWRAVPAKRPAAVRPVEEIFEAGTIFEATSPVTSADRAPERRLTEAKVRRNALAGRLPQGLLPVIWASGLIVLLLRLGLGLLGASRLSREGRSLDDPVWRRLLQRFLSLVAIRRWVRLKSHGKIVVPLTWGIIRPVILMPDDSRNWDEDKRSAALFHELSHVKRVDFAVMLLVRLSLALFWFNPLAWVVFRMLKKDQEKACDELVLKAGIKPSAYAAALLQFKRSAGAAWSPSAALLGLFAKSQLNDRLASILRQKVTFKEVKMKTRIMATATIIFVMALIGSARPAVLAAGSESPATIVAQPPSVADLAQETTAAAVVQEKETSQEVEKKKETQKKEQAEEAKKKAEAKAKDQTKKDIFITTPRAEQGSIEIVVTDGDKTKTLVVGRPLILEGGGPGEEVRLKVDGKDLVLKKGERLALVSKDGSLKLIKEGETLEPRAGAHVILKVDTAGPETVVIKEVPEVLVVKEVEVKPHAHAVAVAPVAVAKPVTIEVVEAGEKGKPYKIILTPRQPAAVAYTLAPRLAGTVSRQEIRQRLEEIQEKLNRIKERKPELREDLKDVEESLKSLTEELEKTTARLEKLRILGEGSPDHFTIVKKEAEGDVKSEVEIIAGEKKADTVSVISREKEGITVIYKAGEGLKDKAACERAVAHVKKTLPEAMTLESKCDEEAGTITLKIKAAEGQAIDEGVVRKVITALKEELKKAPAGKQD